MKRSKLLHLIQILFFGASVFFIGRFLVSNWGTFLELDLKYDYSLILVAFVFSLLSTFFLVLKNKQIYELELYAVRFPLLWKLVCRTNLYRYIPGGIWNHAGLIVDLSREAHITVQKSSKLQLLNLIINIYVGFAFAVFVLPSELTLPFVLLYLLGLISLRPALRVLQLLWNHLFSRQFDLPEIPNRVLLRIVLSNLGFWLFIGLSFVFFLKGINVFKSTNFLLDIYLAASYVLAWLAGFLFIPAPNGIGIRELVMGFFLERASLSLTLGVSVSLLYRVFILARDVMVFVASLLIRD